MEARLKKERRKLFRRIILIMLGIWLVVSGVFCVVRLELEKILIQNNEKTTLQNFTKNLMDDPNIKEENFEKVLPTHVNIFYSGKSQQESINCQLVVTNISTGDISLNTADTIAEEFHYSINDSLNDSLFSYTALIEHKMIKDALTVDQFEEIENFLTKQENGCYYELICTRLQRYQSLTIPIEIKIVKVDKNDSTLLKDKNIKSYSLEKNAIRRLGFYENNDDANRNLIPKEFLYKGERTKNYIGSLTVEERNQKSLLKPQNGFDYLFYTQDTATICYDSYETPYEKWTVEYAKKINLFDNCKKDLFISLFISLGSLSLLSLILCITVWKTNKIKLLTEQQKLDITNALVHDVKTPLFVINGYAQCLKEDIDTQERELYIDKIMEQTDTANSLVCQMLDFSKLDSYQLKLQRTDFDLYELTENVLQNYTALPDDKRIVLTHTGDNTVNADKGLLKTVLQNLTDNAVKYALPNSVILIKINDAAFSIRNQAEPLTKEEIKQLQEPYVHKDKGGKQKGSGLGLSIVRSILELHGAALDIKMKEDTFICSFKL